MRQVLDLGQYNHWKDQDGIRFFENGCGLCTKPAIIRQAPDQCMRVENMRFHGTSSGIRYLPAWISSGLMSRLPHMPFKSCNAGARFSCAAGSGARNVTRTLERFCTGGFSNGLIWITTSY